MVNKFAVLALFVSGAALAASHVSITDKTVTYNSMDEAAKAAIVNIYSINTKIEYAGFIVKHGNMFYITSPFTSGSDDRVSIKNVAVSIPKGSKIVAYYHNHPHITLRDSVNHSRSGGMNFSNYDTVFANKQNYVAYVGIVKNQTILRYDPSNEFSVIVE